MKDPIALLDSNVVIASIAADDEHHSASAALINHFAPHSFAVAAHSYSEVYSGLTHRSRGALFQFDATDVLEALESVASQCVLVGLTHGQTFNAIRDFATGGGIGARLYDRLIGEAAVVNRLDHIVTWKVSHFRELFPRLSVADPLQFVSTYRPRAKGPAAK